MSALAPEAHIHADIPLHAQSKSPAVLQKHARRTRQLPLARHSCADPQGAVLRPCVSAQPCAPAAESAGRHYWQAYDSRRNRPLHDGTISEFAPLRFSV